MIEIKEKKDCCGCNACYNICPKNAIEMKEDEKGFRYPVIDKQKCIQCDLCSKVCPISINKKIENNPIAYACYCKDEKIRINSSSGGMFTLIASQIISECGLVYGASFDEKFNIKHIKVDKIDDLQKLRGSKYVQSDIGNTFKEVKKYLDENRKVLFTGTPCQIEGLKCFLQKDYENLYLQDIICHGVPSPKVWNKYKQYRKNKDKEEPNKINFRNKKDGWSRYCLLFDYKSREYKNTPSKDLYLQMFLQDLSLRDSCYDCKFKKFNRLSDITLADFWGIDNILPEMNDNKGTSLLIINSTKGQKLFDKIKEETIFKEVNLKEAIKYNPSMIHSVKYNAKRDSFFEELDNTSFDKIAKKYLKKANFFKKFIIKLLSIIK